MEIDQVREMLTIIAAAVGLLTGITTAIVTMVGNWFMLRYQLRRHDEQIQDINKKLSNGNGLIQQINRVRENMVSNNRFEHVMFNGPDNVSCQLSRLNDRTARLETRCDERHRHAKESA